MKEATTQSKRTQTVIESINCKTAVLTRHGVKQLIRDIDVESLTPSTLGDMSGVEIVTKKRNGEQGRYFIPGSNLKEVTLKEG